MGRADPRPTTAEEGMRGTRKTTTVEIPLELLCETYPDGHPLSMNVLRVYATLAYLQRRSGRTRIAVSLNEISILTGVSLQTLLHSKNKGKAKKGYGALCWLVDNGWVGKRPVRHDGYTTNEFFIRHTPPVERNKECLQRAKQRREQADLLRARAFSHRITVAISKGNSKALRSLAKELERLPTTAA